MAGDILTFALNDNIKVIKISRIGVRRGPSLEAQTLYQDISPANQLEKFDDHLNIKIGEREAGSGRPTKRQRRDIDELMARGY